MQKTLENWQLEDAKRLKDAFENQPLGQLQFGQKHGIGSQGMVWQYLSGKRPLNAIALLKFCEGVQASPEDISPTIAMEIGSTSGRLNALKTKIAEDRVISALAADGWVVEKLSLQKKSAALVLPEEFTNQFYSYTPDLKIFKNNKHLYVEIFSGLRRSITPAMVIKSIYPGLLIIDYDKDSDYIAEANNLLLEKDGYFDRPRNYSHEFTDSEIEIVEMLRSLSEPRRNDIKNQVLMYLKEKTSKNLPIPNNSEAA